jgi:non-specific serine/threonine protein kinase/serine/threonine-protein kinase
MSDETQRHDSGPGPAEEDDHTRTAGGGPVPHADPAMPASIAGYTIVGKLGEGGMGVVYEAEQLQPRRRVALKVVRGGHFVDDARVRMFKREADTLARLKHPNIGSIYESGRTEDGQHFFAMELVRGDTLDVWLGRRPLDGTGDRIAERLRLLATIADAVHYAHQRGVIHRDLKPSNIIVTDESHSTDSTGSAVRGPGVKILDFGLARITDTDVAATQITEVGVIKGTLPYMSPEQTRGDADAIDVRSDVYALGVILYEMLAGARPYELSSASLMEAVRVICEQPPTPLRQVWSGARKLDPDIETIAGKALAKDPEMRYDSAAALAEDIRRYLTSQPILARPPSTVYQLRKLVARNRLAATLAATMVVLLIGFGVAVSILYARSLAAEASATREAETARRALGFMTEMFEISDPSESRGETVTAREILDRGAARIERELGDQPEIRATLMATMGRVYGGLGLLDRAESLIGSAVTTQRELLGEEHPEALRSSSELGEVLSDRSRYEEAEAMLRETLERQERVLGPEHVDTIAGYTALARVLELQSKFDEAEPLAIRTLATARRVLGDDHELTLRAVNQLGLVLAASARYEEAEQRYLQVLEARRRIHGNDHPDTLSAINNVAELYMTMGRYEESEALFEESLETMRATLGDEHRDTLLFLANLGRLYAQQYRWKEAEEVYRSILETQRRTLGDEHRDTLMSLNTLGVVLSNQERFDEAEPYYMEALDGLRRVLGDRHAETLTIVGNVAMFYFQTGRMEEAEKWGREAYEGSKALHGEDHPTTILHLENLANMRYTQDDLAGAVEILYGVLDGRRRALGDDHPAVSRTLVNLSVVLGSMDDAERATEVREELLQRVLAGKGADYPAVASEIEKLARELYRSEEHDRATECSDEVLRIRRKMLGEEDPLTLFSLRTGVQLAVKAGRWPEAESRALECHETHARVLGADDPKTAQCLELVADGYEAQGDAEQAAAWRGRP